MLVYGIVALGLVALLYFFVTAGSALWPGGPQLEPEAARNLSISLLVVGLLLCGVVFGSLAQSIAPAPPPLEIGGGLRPEDEIEVTPPISGTAAATAETTAVAQGTRTEAATAPIGATPSGSIPTPTPTAAPTREPATLTPTASPTPAALPTALPLDPRVLVETVLRTVIERANQAEVEAILSGDERALDPWWSGLARDRVIANVRNVRSRFVEVTEVSWTPSGEGIRLLSSTVTTATYTTSETWTFVGATGQLCPDGSPTVRRDVETYPSEQYTLRLTDGVYSVTEWQLGPSIVDESRTVCP